MPSETRKHERYRTPRGVSAVLYLRHEDDVVLMGEISDVSEGGLSIRYRGGFGALFAGIGGSPGKAVRVTLVSPDGNARIAGIPCQVVYDASEHYPESMAAVEPRRCGLQFIKLSPEGVAQVEEFVQRYGKQGG